MKYLLALLLLAFGCESIQAAEEPENPNAPWDAKYEKLLRLWRTPDGTVDAKITEDLLDAAIHTDHPETVDEIAADGSYAAREIKLPPTPRTVPLKILRRFGAPQQDSSGLS